MSLTRFVRFCGVCYQVPGEDDVYDFISTKFGLSEDLFWTREASIDIVDVRLRLPGGKGGFGSQLRAQGNRMSSKKRAGNYEACRDLSGRRLRTVKEAQIISDYLKRKPELEAKKAEEIRERMEKTINAATESKHVFKDVDFLRAARDVVDEVELAINEAFYNDPETDDFMGDDKGKEKVAP